jgi:hypothetical protein
MRSPLSVGGVVLALVLLLGAAAPWDSLTVDRSSGALRGSQTNFFGVNSNLLNRAVRLSPLDGGNITSGTVPAARIDATIATDAELLAHTSATNGAHGMSLFGALIAAQANAAAARTQLGLVIGTDVQAFDSDLSALAGLAANGIHVRTGTGTASARTITGTSGRLTVSNGDGVSGNPTVDIDTNSLASAINGGVPNGTGAWLDWSRLRGVPAGFADGTDDGAGGGGSAIGVNGGTGGAVTNLQDSSSITWTASAGSATAKTTHRNLASWNAAQMLPGTTASSQPQFIIRGVGVPAYCFDPSTADLVLLQTEVPSGFNLGGGLELVVKVAPDSANAGTSNVVFQAQYQKLCCGVGTVDSSSYSGAITLTNRLTGAAGVATNLTFSLSGWSGWAAGETVQIELQRIAGATADDSTNRACVISAQLNVISQ